MKCRAGCPKNCPGILPPALGPVIPHPVKNLLEGLRYDPLEHYCSVLDGFPGLPPLEDFLAMLKGKKPMRPCLERFIYQKCFQSYGWSWQIVGGPGGGKLKGRCMRSDGRWINIQELDHIEDEQNDSE